MYIVQKLDEIFCRHHLSPFDLWCDLDLGFLYWFFCLDDLSTGGRVVLISLLLVWNVLIYFVWLI
jgi:hypothetical protein